MSLGKQGKSQIKIGQKRRQGFQNRIGLWINRKQSKLKYVMQF